jgi:hypothetical protein
VPIYDGLLTRMSGAYLVANGEYLGDPSTRSYYSKVGPSPVIKDGSVYRMWPEMVSLPPTFGGPTSYSGQTGSFDSDTVTGYMTSSDGTTWTWYDTNSDGEPNRVIHPNCATNPAGGSTTWMRGEASVGTVLYDSTAGLWKAWGHGGNNTGPRAMWYATASAPEGPWTFQNNGQPILQRDTGAGSFETAFIADARVIRLSATSYVMLYGGHKVTVDRPQVGWATSSDGVTWTKNSSTVPVFGYGASGAWDEEAIYPAGLVYDGTTYHLWYAGCPLGSTTLGTGLGYASSTNGTTWTRGANNPVLGLSASGLDSASLGDTVCAYLDGTVFRINYAGSKTTPNGGAGYFRGRLEATLSTVSGGATTSPNGFTSKPGAARARLGRFYLGGAAVLTSTPPPPYTGSATLPTLLVEIAFGAPTDPPTWTDVTAYVEGFSVRRGRQTALDQMQTGTATVRLSNLDRRFDPSYTGSPYYPNLKRRRRVRIQAVWDGVTYPVFAGYIDRVPQSYGSFQDAWVDLPLRGRVRGARGQEDQRDLRGGALRGARQQRAGEAYWTDGANAKLDDATYGVLDSGATVLAPAGLRDLSAGDVLLDAVTLENTAALTHLQAVQTTELGLLFVARDGTFTFQNRFARVNPGERGHLRGPARQRRTGLRGHRPG